VSDAVLIALINAIALVAVAWVQYRQRSPKDDD
jgi:hypothetical protein